MYLFCFQKYTDSPYSEPLSTEMSGTPVKEEFQQGGTDLLWIVGPVCGAIVLILLVILFIILMRYLTFKHLFNIYHYLHRLVIHLYFAFQCNGLTEPWEDYNVHVKHSLSMANVKSLDA